MNTLIQIENIHYRPVSGAGEQREILRGITLEIKSGSFVAIIGENGSGKTTLINHINGILLPTEGKVIVNGMDTTQPENIRKIRSLVGMVFQNPSNQIVSSTVEEDVAFGLENNNLPTSEIKKLVSDQLEITGLTDEAKRPPHLLSGGQIQRLALAGVLARKPEVILLDEPTSMLDPAARDVFLQRLFVLRDQGKTIVYVTHHLQEIIHADQVIVLHEGQVKLSGSPWDVFSRDDILREIGLDIPETIKLADRFRSFGWDIPKGILSAQDLMSHLPDYYGEKNLRTPKLERRVGENLITARSVHYTYLAGTPLAQPALKGADLDVAAHSVHGIAGTNGSGKSTLLQHLNGILRPEKGTVHVGDLLLEDPETRLRDVIRKVGLVFQNPEVQFFEVFVGDEIAYGPKQLGLSDIRSRVKAAMTLVGLDFELFKDRRLETLSGGEKRKAALASTLVLDQDIILFDEPTAGMDPRARQGVLGLFTRLSEAGKTIVIASHQLDELAHVSEDLSLMASGRVIDTSQHRERLFDHESIARAGLLPPLSVRLTQTLIRKGWPIGSQDTSTPDKLVGILGEVLK